MYILVKVRMYIYKNRSSQWALKLALPMVGISFIKSLIVEICEYEYQMSVIRVDK